MTARNPPPPGVVDLWTAPLHPADDVLSELIELLAPDELARAGRFRSAKRRAAFVASRGFQRRVLAHYTAIPPARLAFAHSPAGKPALIGNPPDVRFNVANGGAWAVCAVATGRDVGVDIEPLRSVPDALPLAHRFFSPDEYRALAVLSAESRDAAFLRCWTAKEAWVKALGLGFAASFDNFIAPVSPNDEFTLRDAATGRPIDGWTLHPLTIGDDHVGAIVVEGESRTVRCRRE